MGTMRKIKTFIILSAALLAGISSSCSDSYMEDLNTDKSKANSIDPNAQLTTAELQTYGDLGMVEIYRNYLYAFTQQLMGCWNTTNYGGRHTVDNNEMGRIWTSFYPKAIKNLTDAIHRSAEDGNRKNINAILRIYSLSLRYAMRISDVAPEKARKEFEDALASEGGVLTSGSDDALIKYMDISFSFGQDSYTDYRGNALSQLLFGNDPANNPSYLCSTFFNQLYNTKDPRTFMIARFYYDGLMSQTSPDNRIDLTDEITGKGIAMNPCQPGAFSYDPWPQGYDSDMMKEIAKTNPSVETTMARETEPKLANNFLRGDNPGVVMTCAEVNLLLAEASLKKWNTGGSVEGFYSKGVRAAMDFLADNYGYDRISDNDFNAYIAGNGIGHTEQQAKAAINTQAWILHFTNPAECWANVRRSGYPRLKSPAEYGFGQYLTGGKDIPVRLCYPTLESSYNKPGYDEALKRMGGKDSWNTHVWWDVE